MLWAEASDPIFSRKWRFCKNNPRFFVRVIWNNKTSQSPILLHSMLGVVPRPRTYVTTRTRVAIRCCPTSLSQRHACPMPLRFVFYSIIDKSSQTTDSGTWTCQINRTLNFRSITCTSQDWFQTTKLCRCAIFQLIPTRVENRPMGIVKSLHFKCG